MKEVPKETDNMIKDSIEASNNEIPVNNNIMQKFECVNEYTPFKFNFEHNIKEKKNVKKYFAFIYYENSNNNNISNEKSDKNKNTENEEDIINESEKNQNNEKNVKINNNNNVNNIINTSYNSINSNNNVKYMNNLDNLIDIVKEDDENEYTESEEHRVVDYHSHSYSGDDFGVINFNVRPNSCIKTIVINIIDTYNLLDPNYKYVKKEEEEKNIILTVPSEPVKNNGKDNENDDLIVSKEDEFKNKENKNTYIIKDILGTGVSGQAFKVFCPNTNNYLALKIIKNNDLFRIRSLFEIKIMKTLNDNDKNDQYHIIRLHDFFMSNGHLCIVIELLHKTLLQLLDMSNSEGISLNSIRFILKQILQSVDFIHSLKIVHTDLKPENILLSVYKGGDINDNRNSNLNLSYNLNNQKNNPNQINTNNNTSGINNASNISLINKRVSIKIADFGEATYLKNLDKKSYIQSMFYRAPEVILHNNLKNEKVDVWSIGCILGELYLGTPLMPGNSNYDQLYKITVLIGECPQDMIENSIKKDIYFIKDKDTYNYRIKNPKEFFMEYPKVPKSEYEIPRNMKNLDDIINIKKGTIKSKNSLHKSMHNSSLSLNSSNTKEDLVAFIHLMKCMLQIDPNKRWSCKQCLKHPFLTKEKLDKFIRSEVNEINQLMSNSFNSNNSYNFHNNNCHSMVMNNSFNKFQPNKGGNLNKNNTFYGGGNFNSKNRNNYSFGNFNINNNNYNNFMYQQTPIIPEQIQGNFMNNNNNNILYQLNYNNNNNFNYQGNNNNINNNKKLNSSFSFKNNYNYNNMIPYNNLYQFNFVPNRVNTQNFMPFQNMPFYPNNLMYNINNQNMNNRMNPMFNNNPQKRYNKSYMGTSFERLNTSYNSNLSKNSKQNALNNQQFHKNKKNSNPKEFFFNKEHLMSGSVEDNKQDIKNKDKDKDITNDNNITNKLNKNNDANDNLNVNVHDGGGNKINPEIDKNGDDPNEQK